MYRVFLVDDEIAIREGIRNSHLWDAGTFTLVGEASDGEMALPMLQDEAPDILITDIRMPFMDGMQLCAEVRRLMPWMKVIILSGYDDFNYARQAMSLGVQEYLLKPVSSDDLRAALLRVQERIDQDARSRSSMEQMQKRLKDSNRFLKEKLITAVLTDPPDAQNTQNLLEQLRALGINLVAQCYAVIDLMYTPPKGDRGTFHDALYAVSESNKGTVYLCSSRHGTLALVLGDNAADIEERCYAFARSVTGELERMGCADILASIGEMVTALPDIARSADSARHMRHAEMRKADGADTPRIVGVDETGDSMPGAIELAVRPLFESMQYATLEEVDTILRDYALSLGTADIHYAVAADYFHVECLMTAARIVRDAGGDPREALDTEAYQRRLLLKEAKTEYDLTAATSLLRQAVTYRDARDANQVHTPIARARAYLAQHFTDPNLMLQDVAGFVGMSNSRFSTVFAQKAGTTFTEHLTALRIGKAQELLRAADMRSSQIAFAVGYNDPHYFSYLFKKKTGMTPSEYRKTERPQ